jgi:hypothetical protein
VALVNKRLRNLTVDPALLKELNVELAGESGVQRARALLPWLGLRGAAIRRLRFEQRADGPLEQEAGILSAVCLVAACGAAPLRELYVRYTQLPTLAWLPLVAGSLKVLVLTTSQRLTIDASMAGMTQLTRLDLRGSFVPAPGARLPPKIRHLQCTSSTRPPSRLLAQVRASAELCCCSVAVVGGVG